MIDLLFSCYLCNKIFYMFLFIVNCNGIVWCLVLCDFLASISGIKMLEVRSIVNPLCGIIRFK